MLLDDQSRGGVTLWLAGGGCTAEERRVNLMGADKLDQPFHLAVETFGVLAIATHLNGGAADLLQAQVALRQCALEDVVETVMAAQLGGLWGREADQFDLGLCHASGRLVQDAVVDMGGGETRLSGTHPAQATLVVGNQPAFGTPQAGFGGRSQTVLR